MQALQRARPSRHVCQRLYAPRLVLANQKRGIRDWRDYVPGMQRMPPEMNARGSLRDTDDATKKRARATAARRGRTSLFDKRPQQDLSAFRKPLPIKKHLRDKIPLRPHPERPWYKTYKIREKLDARTRVLQTSHRKLNKLANQISGKPIDYAILQMKFSEKRISSQVERLLLETKQRAKELEMNMEDLVVSQAWVGKGPKQPKRIDIRARGKFGIIRKSRSTMTIRLGRGLTEQQALEKRAQRALDKVKIPEMVKNETRVRFPRSQWAW